MNVIQAGIYEKYKGLELQGTDRVVRPHIELEPILESVVKGVRSSLLIFSGAVALLLLIACANVANLLLSRALTRQGEMSVRLALGATRWHLIGQLLCESAVLSLLGGMAGSLFAWWRIKLVIQFSAGAIPRVNSVTLDWKVLGFTLLVSLVTGILFGLAPAWQTSKANLSDALRAGANRQTSGRSHHYVRNAFTVTQIALALVLLIGAGLLIQSFQQLQSVKPGYDTDKLLIVEVPMSGAAYAKTEQRVVFLRRIIEEMEATPGVEAVSGVSILPIDEGWPYPYSRSDRPVPPPNKMPRAGLRSVAAGYHKTYGISTGMTLLPWRR